jgi:glycosyltransferase involved in cell wall biosynthesis
MYAGIPIMASDCAPLKRIIEETATGSVFRNEDARSFAESLDQLLSDKAYLEKIPENGRRWVEEKYNWRFDAAVLCSIYGTPGDVISR